MATTFRDLSRQRLDFDETPDGKTRATLTVTLQDGSVHRYSATTDQEELDSLGAALATHEVKARQIAGELSEDEIAGLFGSIGSAFKSVANVAKKVVTSKVFKAAGKGLAMAAPALGPFAPAAMAVSGGMMAASKLGDAVVAAEAGAKHASRALTGAARRAVEQVTPRSRWGRGTSPGSDPKSRYTAAQIKAMRAKGTRDMLLAIANAKRKKAFALAAKKPKRTKRERMRAIMAKRRARRRKGKPPARRRGKKPNIVLAARKGQLRSNKPGSITLATLRSADRKGRVYWIAA